MQSGGLRVDDATFISDCFADMRDFFRSGIRFCRPR
jgi:hypothetical protein